MKIGDKVIWCPKYKDKWKGPKAIARIGKNAKIKFDFGDGFFGVVFEGELRHREICSTDLKVMNQGHHLTTIFK